MCNSCKIVTLNIRYFQMFYYFCPLSPVIVYIQSFIGCNASMVFKGKGAASFLKSLRIYTLEVSLSLMKLVIK